MNFTIDLGSLYNLSALMWSVDHNDNSYAQYSLDGISYSPLFTMTSAAGDRNKLRDRTARGIAVRFSDWCGKIQNQVVIVSAT